MPRPVSNDQAGNGTIGETIEILLYGSARAKKPVNYSYILRRVKEDHPKARTTKGCVDYYAWNLRRQGIEVKVARSK